jgi:hypothetical protein
VATVSARIRITFVAATGAGIFFVIASCAFEPEIADGAFACSTDRTCPTGYVCASDGRCYRPGAGPAGGGGTEEGGTSGPNGPFVIAGEVKGLAGKGLVLQDVGTDDLTIEQSGPFEFTTRLPRGALYNVTVSTQPSEPSQTCTVANAAGVVNDDVRNVAVDCKTAAFAVGGTVIGNLGTGLVLANNGGDDLLVNALGAFAFNTKIESGKPYAVTVKTQPTGGGPCTVSGGTGTVGVTDVTSAVVNCTPNTYTVGGTVSGLIGSVVVQLNGGNDRTLTANGSFAFPNALNNNASYAVTVKTNPGYPPRAQECVVGAGTGNVPNADVTNVTITCTTRTFSVGGSVTNLNGTVQLTNNGGDQIDVKASGPFTFPTNIASGNTYAVAVKKQPDKQTCSIANGNGTVKDANVTNVSVSCQAQDPGILCGTAYCDPKKTICCAQGKNDKSSPSCEGPSTGCSPAYACDSTGDCASIAGTICCGKLNPVGALASSSCQSFQNCTAGGGKVLCDAKIPTECANGGKCTVGDITNPGFVKDGYGICK